MWDSLDMSAYCLSQILNTRIARTSTTTVFTIILSGTIFRARLLHPLPLRYLNHQCKLPFTLSSFTWSLICYLCDGSIRSLWLLSTLFIHLCNSPHSRGDPSIARVLYFIISAFSYVPLHWTFSSAFYQV